MAIWDEFLTERDRAVYAAAGYGVRMGFGRSPAVLVIDVNRAFCGGDAPAPILESVAGSRTSCGEEAWRAVGHIATLLAAARRAGVPVLYSTGVNPKSLFERGRWADKNRRAPEDLLDARGNDIVTPIAPAEGEIVIEKAKPSVFFATLLAAYLTDLSVDSLLVCGTTTSGCVRATVVDAFSLNYRVSVVEECTFDRGQASHALNLFDMHQKYADVVGLEEVCDYLATLEARPKQGVAPAPAPTGA